MMSCKENSTVSFGNRSCCLSIDTLIGAFGIRILNEEHTPDTIGLLLNHDNLRSHFTDRPWYHVINIKCTAFAATFLVPSWKRFYCRKRRYAKMTPQTFRSRLFSSPFCKILFGLVHSNRISINITRR